MVGGVAGGTVVEADAGADEEEHVAVVAVGGVEIVFGADAEAAETGVEKDGAVAGGVDCRGGLPGDGLVEGLRPVAPVTRPWASRRPVTAVERRRWATAAMACSARCWYRPRTSKDAEVGLDVGEDGFDGGGEEAEAVEGKGEAVRDIEGAEFAEEAAAGGADGPADFFIFVRRGGRSGRARRRHGRRRGRRVRPRRFRHQTIPHLRLRGGWYSGS